MTTDLRALCERLSQGLEQDPRQLAARLGTIDQVSAYGSIRVAPSGPEFSAAEIWADPASGTTDVIALVPGPRLTLGDVKAALGPYAESPRLHPGDPRKARFSPWEHDVRPISVVVIAHVAADAVADESAPIERLRITCSPRSASATVTPPEASDASPPRTVWTPLLGRVSFGLASWRQGSLSDVRDELERVLGVQFVPCHEKVYEGKPAFECTLPGCGLRLNAWPSVHPELTYFNFIAVRGPDHVPGTPPPENISDALAAHLRSAGCDWYVPGLEESYEGAGVLGDEILDPDVVVAMLAPRWLAWVGEDEKANGRNILRHIAEGWIAAARGTAEPREHVARRRAELEGWSVYAPPRARLALLGTYAVAQQLSAIHDELFELRLMTDAERAQQHGLGARLAELRAVLDTIAAPVRQSGVEELRDQHAELCATVDQLRSSAGAGG